MQIYLIVFSANFIEFIEEFHTFQLFLMTLYIFSPEKKFLLKK
jgi:hypothetical protein